MLDYQFTQSNNAHVIHDVLCMHVHARGGKPHQRIIQQETPRLNCPSVISNAVPYATVKVPFSVCISADYASDT